MFRSLRLAGHELTRPIVWPRQTRLLLGKSCLWSTQHIRCLTPLPLLTLVRSLVSGGLRSIWFSPRLVIFHRIPLHRRNGRSSGQSRLSYIDVPAHSQLAVYAVWDEPDQRLDRLAILNLANRNSSTSAADADAVAANIDLSPYLVLGGEAKVKRMTAPGIDSTTRGQRHGQARTT